MWSVALQLLHLLNGRMFYSLYYLLDVESQVRRELFQEVVHRQGRSHLFTPQPDLQPTGHKLSVVEAVHQEC